MPSDFFSAVSFQEPRGISAEMQNRPLVVVCMGSLMCEGLVTQYTEMIFILL